MSNISIFTDSLFPSDNDLEVPTLDLGSQATSCEIPFVCYGEQARTFQMNGNGTLHFYTDDYRYRDIFDYPEKIAKHNPHNIVEPNFSLFCETPVAFGLKEIYKKRWLARSMQTAGINIFVDLNVNSKFYKLNMLGVPIGWSSYCTRGYSDRLQYLQFEYDLAKQWSNGNPLLFVIYGGGQKCKAFAQTHNCIYVSPMIDLKNNYKRAMKKITDSVCFQSPEFDIKRIAENSWNDMRTNQIKDYRNE